MGYSSVNRSIDVLLVSADPVFLSQYADRLDRQIDGHCYAEETVEAAIDRLDTASIDCIISDHNLPEMDGLAFLETIRAQYPILPFILFTSHGGEQVASKAISADVTEYLIKDRSESDEQSERLGTLIEDAVRYYRSRSDHHEREQRTRVLLDAAHDGIAVVRDGVFEYLNVAGCALFDIDDRSQVTGTPISAVLDGDCGVRSLIQDVQTGVRSVDQRELSLPLADGTRQSVSMTATRIEWDGNPAVALVVREAGASKTARKERRQFRRAVEAAGHAIYITDPDGTITYVNPAFEEITGHDREEVLGEKPSIFQSGEMSESYYDRLWETLEAGNVWREEICNRRKNGDLYYANQTIAPIRSWDGNVSNYVAIQTDVTEQKAIEQELKQYERAITGATDLIAAVDSEGQFRFANPQYCAYHGIDRQTVTTRTVGDVLGEEAGSEVFDHIERALSGRTVRYRTTRQHPTMGERTLDVRYYPLRDGNEITGVVAVLRDVTDSTNRARQLRVVDRILRHNLRNALTAVRLRAEQLIEGQGDPLEVGTEIVDKVDSLLTTSQKSRSITDILAEQPRQQQVDLVELLDRVMVSVSEQYPTATVELTAENSVIGTATPNLRDAVEELLTNAIVHHDREHPTIQLTASIEDNSAVIEVADDGPGIPEMDLAVLERGKATGDLYHGSGLGLWLVFWIVQRSGGSISVRDADPRGTVVRITLPQE